MTRTLPTVVELEHRIESLTVLIRSFDDPDDPHCQRHEDERQEAIRLLLDLIEDQA